MVSGTATRVPLSQIVAGFVLDIKRAVSAVVLLYRHRPIFSVSIQMEGVQCHNPRPQKATTTTIGNWTGRDIRPIGNKECKEDRAKQILIGQRAKSSDGKAVSGNTSYRPIKNLILKGLEWVES